MCRLSLVSPGGFLNDSLNRGSFHELDRRAAVGPKMQLSLRKQLPRGVERVVEVLGGARLLILLMFAEMVELL